MQNQEQRAAEFIKRWEGVTASELSTSQSFIIDLCELLEVPRPHATEERDYMFERPIKFTHGDGNTTDGRIDCYRRGAFVWESKKLNPGVSAKDGGPTTASFNAAMKKARTQAEDYARSLPAEEGRPPFVVVVDVGHVIELYAEFTRTGATYTPFPDPGSNRIRLTDLTNDKVRERLKLLWTDPLSLNPARASAKVTREVATELAELAKSLEAAGNSAEDVAGFLTRCLFSMFAEDIGLLPNAADSEGSFLHLLREHREEPDILFEMLRLLWQGMDTGGFNAAIRKKVLHFNGKLFKNGHRPNYVLPLTKKQIDGLMRAARANWKEVEPAIFGTLLERALNPEERHSFGAHFTPRAYVERLVLPTVVEPLRSEWENAQAASLLLWLEADELTDSRKREAKREEARAEIRRFHHRLCTVRVLDPACGSGNFLYITLEHLKRLEGEVLKELDDLGDTQAKLGFAGETVTLKQFLGIEVNERAAAVAELVLWIGWLQWHVRTSGVGSVAEPVVHDYQNIEHRDAVLAYDTKVPAVDAAGKTIVRWDGRTKKKHPVTGEEVPDETAVVPQWAYINPRKAEWPDAEFIVGNPPFIGNKRMRELLGDGYSNALRDAWPDVPESADFVMYWWNYAAEIVRLGNAVRFGFITTNSLTMIFNRRIIELHQGGTPALGIAFAVPDHPWVDSAGGAAVRISMSVGARACGEGRLVTVSEETESGDGEVAVKVSTRQGLIHPDLKIGADITRTSKLKANFGLSSMGMMRAGNGFIVESEAAARELGLGKIDALTERIRPFRNGRDLTDRPRGYWLIDLFGLSEEELRTQFPHVYQWVLERVKPERDVNRRPRLRDSWWIFGEPRQGLRAALRGLPRYIATVETAKYRLFTFLDAAVLPDHKLVAIASSDPLHLGILSSSLHAQWALATGGTLEDRPVYSKSRCFDPFPMPDADMGLSMDLCERIGDFALQIDTHRKSRQAETAALTLTGMYNVLEKLRRDEPLNPKEQAINSQGLVGVLRTLHDDLDAAVLAAYGWSDLGPVPWKDDAARQAWTEAVLTRLVALNAKRAAEEAQGTVRWLRPDFQDPARSDAAPKDLQAGIEMEEQGDGATDDAPPAPAAAVARMPWPAALPEQMKVVADVLSAAPGALNETALADRFTGRGPWKKRLPQILQTLEAVGRASRHGEAWRGN